MKIKLPRFRKKTEVIDAPTLPQGVFPVSQEDYEKDLQQAYNVGHAAGYAEGISVAKRAATNQLKELIWQQKNHSQATADPTAVPNQ